MALIFPIMLGSLSPVAAQPFSPLLSSDISTLPAAPCWLEETIRPIAKRKPQKPKVRKRTTAVHQVRRQHRAIPRRSVATRHRARPARTIHVAERTFHWVCLPLPPPDTTVPSFAADFAERMAAYPANETFQQWVIDRTPQKRRLWRSEPVSLAPEPASWIMMIGGIFLIGWVLRHVRRPAMSRANGEKAADRAE